MYNMMSENKKMFEFVINVVLFLNIYFLFQNWYIMAEHC